MIETLKEFSSESAASRAAEGLRFKLNQDKRQLSPIEFGFLINHYVEHELPKASKSTRKTNLGYIRNWVEPDVARRAGLRNENYGDRSLAAFDHQTRWNQVEDPGHHVHDLSPTVSVGSW